MIVSIDGASQESFAKYRIGGDLNKILKGLEQLVTLKNTFNRGPKIIWQTVVSQYNENEIDKIRLMANKIGVDEFRLKTAQSYLGDYADTFIPITGSYSRYVRGNNGTWRIKNRLYNHCWRMWSAAVITWDGRVVPCCFDKDAKYEMGQMNGMKFGDIWRGLVYTEFRSKLLQQRADIDICQNCTEGTKVWI